MGPCSCIGKSAAEAFKTDKAVPVSRGIFKNSFGIENVNPGACMISRVPTFASTSAVRREILSASLQERLISASVPRSLGKR